MANGRLVAIPYQCASSLRNPCPLEGTSNCGRRQTEAQAHSWADEVFAKCEDNKLLWQVFNPFGAGRKRPSAR